MSLTRHCNRFKKPQETIGSRKSKFQSHSIWICTWKQKKRNPVHKSSLQGTPPKGRPKQEVNYHRWQQGYLPRGFSNPNRFPWASGYHYKQWPLPPWRKIFLLWREKNILPPRWMDQNMRKSILAISRLNLLNNIICKTFLIMGGFILKFSGGAIAYLKVAS